jgi:hypothetical protein
VWERPAKWARWRFKRYRLQSLMGQDGMGKMSPHRVVHIIEQPLARGMACSRTHLLRLQESSKSSVAACL